MSKLRVDKIVSRTGSVVEIPDSNTLAVTGIVSVTSSGSVTNAGNFTNTGNLTVAGNFEATTGVITASSLDVGSFTPTDVTASGIVTAGTGFNVGVTTFHSTRGFVHDVVSTGIVTATAVDAPSITVGTAVTISGGIVSATSYRGDGSQLTGIDASTLKDSGNVTRAAANTTGVVVTGVLTATSFVGDGSALTGVGETISGGVVNTYTENGINYKSHTFFDGGNFNCPLGGLVVDFYIQGGGGSGGQHSTTNANGGGGAGGCVIGRGVTFAAGSYAVMIGQGGEGVCQPEGTGNMGHESRIYGPGPSGIGYTGLGGGAGHGTGNSNTPVGYQFDNVVTGQSGNGGCGGGRSPTANPNYLTNQYVYDAPTAPMPITTFNDAPFRNSGIINGYGNPGGGSSVSWTGAGGGGVGGPGRNGSNSTGVTGGGSGGTGVVIPWMTGTAEYLGGGGGGSGNSSERAGDGWYGGGRGNGNNSSDNEYNYPISETGGPNYGMRCLNAKDGTGAGGGAASYWHSPSAGQPARSGKGGSGRVIIRYEV